MHGGHGDRNVRSGHADGNVRSGRADGSMRDGRADGSMRRGHADGQHARSGIMRDERAACATDVPLAGHNIQSPHAAPSTALSTVRCRGNVGISGVLSFFRS